MFPAAKAVEHSEAGSYYPVYARFGRTDGLQIGNAVRLAGITVGRVTDAKLDSHYNAILTLEMKEGIKIPDDSSASIVSDGIPGTKYIEIEPGGSEDFLPPKGEFNYTRTPWCWKNWIERIIVWAKPKPIQQRRNRMKNGRLKQ